MSGGNRLDRRVLLRTGPSRGGYVAAALLWLGGWLGFFGHVHQQWWRLPSGDVGAAAVARPVEITGFPMACLGLAALGFLLWLGVFALRSGAQRRMQVAG